MNTKVASEPLKAWWGITTDRENKLATIDMLIFIVFALPLNPQMYRALNAVADKSARYGAGGYGVYFAQAIFLLLCGGCLSLAVIYINQWRKTHGETDKEVWVHRFGGGKFSKLKVNLKVIQASQILSENTLKLFQKSKAPQVLYRVAESNEYITSNHVFSKLMDVRLLPIFTSMLAINFILYSIADAVMLIAMLHSFAILALLIIVDVIYSFLDRKRRQKSLMAIAAQSALSPNKTYCEYQLLIGCKLTNESQGELLFNGDSVVSLMDMKEAKHPIIENLLCALDHLSRNSYVAIYHLNNEANAETNKISNSKRFDDIKQLHLLLDSYIPDLLVEIRRSLTVSNIVTHYHHEEPSDAEPSTVDTDVLLAYKELHEDVLKQNDIVVQMQNHYQSATKNKTIEGFRSVIQKQAKGWQALDFEQSYSLKTNVLDKNLNKKLIPELQILLTNTKDEKTKTRIKDKISEINTFFDEQVEIDKKAVALTHEPNPIMQINSGAIPSEEDLNLYLTKVDFYVDELKKDW